MELWGSWHAKEVCRNSCWSEPHVRHRGPHDHGTVILREEHPEAIELGLGNRRPAIFDLADALDRVITQEAILPPRRLWKERILRGGGRLTDPGF